jgi:hypothetical protein
MFDNRRQRCKDENQDKAAKPLRGGGEVSEGGAAWEIGESAAAGGKGRNAPDCETMAGVLPRTPGAGGRWRQGFGFAASAGCARRSMPWRWEKGT